MQTLSYTDVPYMNPIEEPTTIDIESLASPASVSLKPTPKIENHKSFDDNDFTNKPVAKKSNTIPIKAAVYSVADLQMATYSFSFDNLVGEGTFGRVYRAQFDNGKVCYIFLYFFLYISECTCSFFFALGKSYVHHTQSGRTLPGTPRKRELRAPCCPLVVMPLQVGLIFL
jgi:hypothetical protein